VFRGIETTNLSAIPAIAESLVATGLDPRSIVVGPDAESEPWASDLGSRLGIGHVVARKARHGDRSVQIVLPDDAALGGRPVLLFDDIIASGGTIIACARALRAAGAERVDVVVTHALFPEAMLPMFAEAGVASVRSTSSVRHPTNWIRLDGVIADALAEEFRREP
jgi:ribose-phosphate pyrophosphokinase